MEKRPLPIDFAVLWRGAAELLSFEAALLLFLFAGIYKIDPRLAWFPVDLTLFFFVLSLALGAVIVLREGFFLAGFAVVAVAAVFVGWVALTQTWTPGMDYANEKLAKLATLTFWSLVATTTIVASRPERTRRFMLLLLVFGTVATLDALYQYATSPRAFSSTFRLENYLVQARLFGAAALVALGFWMRAHPLSSRGLALLIAFGVCCLGILITGGRGPTLAVAAATLIPLALGTQFIGKRLFVRKSVVAVGVIVVVSSIVVAELVIPSGGSFRTVQRFNDLFTEIGGGFSASQRLRNWREALLFWFQQPVIGHGNGSWPIIRFGVDTKRYPHNLVLEVLTEYGIVGLVLLGLVILAACHRITAARLRDEPALMCAAMLAVSEFINALTSNDITENRVFFAMLGLLAIPPAPVRPHGCTEGGSRDIGAPGRRRPDLHEAMPHAGRGRL